MSPMIAASRTPSTKDSLLAFRVADQVARGVGPPEAFETLDRGATPLIFDNIGCLSRSSLLRAGLANHPTNLRIGPLPYVLPVSEQPLSRQHGPSSRDGEQTVRAPRHMAACGLSAR
jgi:hypothetical protein